MADWSLTQPAFADQVFRERFEHTLDTLERDDEAIYGVAITELVELLHRFVPKTEWDRADKWLGFYLTYDAERRAGRSETEAMAAARSFRPLRYRLSTENSAEFDLRGAMRLPHSLSRQQRKEADQFFADVLADRPLVGRPPGSGLHSCDEIAAEVRTWYTKLSKSSARPPSRQLIARKMGIDRSTLTRNMDRCHLEWPSK